MTDDLPPDPDKISFTFPCIRARQPIGDIFIASIPHKRLQSITYFDVRRVLREERDFERYLGIQRPLDERRVSKLSEYVNYKDASFPTSIILALTEGYVAFDPDEACMTVSNFRDGEDRPTINLAQIARVLDGQHRIAGLQAFDGEKDEFDLSVTLFIGADIADQAQIFATVNLEQTKVNKSLVYDLYDLAHSRSPQKTCHNIAVALDRDPNSPFFKRIKRLGIATEGRIFEPITQATFVEALLSYISKDPRADRDRLLRGKKLEKLYGEELYKMPLRNIFIEERDVDLGKIINNYFLAVQRRWPDAWDERGRGSMLNRTNGFRALMRFFRKAYLQVAEPGDVPSDQRFLDRVFHKIPLESSSFNTDNFSAGTSGEARLYRVLRGEEAL